MRYRYYGDGKRRVYFKSGGRWSKHYYDAGHNMMNRTNEYTGNL